MADKVQIDRAKPAEDSACHAFEAMLADATDGTLAAAEQRWFDLHALSCVHCAAALADARRGAAWLELLRAPRPEPSAGLLHRILAQTSTSPVESAHSVPLQDILPSQPNLSLQQPATARVLPFRLRVPRVGATAHTFEPRLAMTAAMAFFSIALTLNLSGVRLQDVRASDLRPSSLKRTCFQAGAQAVRFYDNLRVVHVLQSRVEDLRQATQDQAVAPPRQPASNPDHSSPAQPAPSSSQPAPAHRGGVSQSVPSAELYPHALLAAWRRTYLQSSHSRKSVSQGGLA